MASSNSKRVPWSFPRITNSDGTARLSRGSGDVLRIADGPSIRRNGPRVLRRNGDCPRLAHADTAVARAAADERHLQPSGDGPPAIPQFYESASRSGRAWPRIPRPPRASPPRAAALPSRTSPGAVRPRVLGKRGREALGRGILDFEVQDDQVGMMPPGEFQAPPRLDWRKKSAIPGVPRPSARTSRVSSEESTISTLCRLSNATPSVALTRPRHPCPAASASPHWAAVWSGGGENSDRGVLCQSEFWTAPNGYEIRAGGFRPAVYNDK